MKATTNSAAKRTTPRTGSACLALTHPTAQDVCIAGSFNDWHPTVTPMIRLEDGKWARELALPPGRYEYRFVVDGQWVDDPAATELVPNSFGTANAVLVVTETHSGDTKAFPETTQATRGRIEAKKPSAQREPCCA